MQLPKSQLGSQQSHLRVDSHYSVERLERRALIRVLERAVGAGLDIAQNSRQEGCKRIASISRNDIKLWENCCRSNLIRRELVRQSQLVGQDGSRFLELG